jgi:hypothetical protein
VTSVCICVYLRVYGCSDQVTAGDVPRKVKSNVYTKWLTKERENKDKSLTTRQ